MGKWQTHWRKKGHISKQRVQRHYSIDSAQLYDTRSSPLEIGEEYFAYSCQIKLFPTKVFFSTPTDSLNYSYFSPIETTKCNYGGIRHWFLCTNQKCKRRCKKLYMDRQGYFFCRKCLNLAYITQNRSQLDRIIDKKWKLIRKLGAESDFVLDSQKPKGMHWKTFDQIRNQIAELDLRATLGISDWFTRRHL